MFSPVFSRRPTVALWDTGAQASIINKTWRQTFLPNTEVRAIEELLGPSTISGLAVNQTEIQFSGWAEVEFKLEQTRNPDMTLKVPILICPDARVAEEPIIGYNVIAEVIRQCSETEGPTLTKNLLDVLSLALSLNPEGAEALMQVLQSDGEEMGKKTVKIGKVSVKLPPGQLTLVQACAHSGPLEEDMVMFVPEQKLDWPEGVSAAEVLVTLRKGSSSRTLIPILNNTKHNIILGKRISLGHLEPVKGFYPALVQQDNGELNSSRVCCTELKTESKGGAAQEESGKVDEKWDPPVPLDHLTDEQRVRVKHMLREECKAFARDEKDIGCIPSLQMHITLKDTTPVQKTYMSIPKPLHQEVKQYVQDLFNRGWIRKSRSPYSSPVVVVRKKDDGLRLCCDYRELNRKTVPDRHPIPRIQDLLDSLCGSSWFSVLDQGKVFCPTTAHLYKTYLDVLNHFMIFW